MDENGYIYASCYSPNYHAFIKLDNNLQLIFMKRFYDFVPVTSAVGFNSYYICGNTPDGAAVLRYNKNTGALQQFNQYEKAILFDGKITNSGFAIAELLKE
ncbi:MAG: hypothetical protein IPP29_19275 [Bacteroidetes bacterium]|nr:hypothetical protein [Bacteroidota bacterium]